MQLKVWTVLQALISELRYGRSVLDIKYQFLIDIEIFLNGKNLMNIAFVQPILTKYREPVLEELAAHSKLAVFFSKETLDKGFGDINNGLDYSAHVISTKNLFDKVFWQVGLVKRRGKVTMGCQSSSNSPKPNP